MAFELKSPAFDAGTTIPKKYTCDGDDISPPLRWEDAPTNTESFALIMEDPDAPPGTWIHWVLYGLPADTRYLEENIKKNELVKDGVKQGVSWGVKDFSRVGYYGPCPPPGPAHHYHFKLYALDKKRDLPTKLSKDMLLDEIKEHIIGETELIGKYGR